MSRRGRRDLKPRKRRSDIGKSRNVYAGKPIKHKRRRYWNNPKGNKKSISIWIWAIERMSEDARMRFPPESRNKVVHQTWRPLPSSVYIVDVKDIDNKEKLGQFVSDRYYEGTFAIKTFINKKNYKKYPTNKVKAIVVIGQNDEGNYVKSFKDLGFYRYWFWHKG